MVVNGGCFHSLVIPYSNHVDLTNYHSNMSAGKAVLYCRPNSHPFVDRTLSLEQPVKIGRSVARARTSQNNGIFDCKVLSRNHALIWYSNGKFYLQDTKSSNGTFVNNQRLSKSGEESVPREVSSGDIVQFGVDVLENARKVTHGCIIANLKLFLPDGKEAKASPSTSVLSGIGNVSIEDLYQLNQHIQEALQREQMLQMKLASLNQLVSSLRQAADLGWKALIAEDRLLSRVEILENQLQTYAKNFAEDKLREELRKLQEDKSTYQGLAKECLQKLLQEKLEAVQKCQDIERALLNAEAECANFKEIMERDHEELQELALKHNNQIIKTVELENKLQDAEEQNKDALARLEAENEDLNNEVKRLLANEAVMHEKIQNLEVSGRLVGRQLLGMHSQLKLSTDINNHLSSFKERNGSTDGLFDESISDEKEFNHENEKDIEINSYDSLLIRLTSSVEEHKRSKEVVDLIEAQVSLLLKDKMSKLQQINSLESELGIHENKMCKYKEENKTLESTLDLLEQQAKDEANPNKMETNIIDTTAMNGGGERNNYLNSEGILHRQLDEFRELVKESRSKMEATERTIDLLQVDMNDAKKSLSEITKNWLLQDEKLKEAKTLKEETENTVALLREQLKTLESSIILLNKQEKIDLESEHIKQKEENTLLKQQLVEIQHCAWQYKNEAVIVKDKLQKAIEALGYAQDMCKKCTDEKDVSLYTLKSKIHEVMKNDEYDLMSMGDQETPRTHFTADSQLDNKASEELAAAKLEVSSLQSQVVSLELQIKKLTNETCQKQQELAESIHTGTSTLEETETVIQKLRLRVSELEEELVLVKEKYMACNEKNTQLEKELNNLRQDYEAVVHQPYFVNQRYLLGVIVSVVIAFLLTMVGLYPSS